MPEQHDRYQGPSAAERKQKREAQEAAQKEAAQVVERWNRALAAGRGSLWSPTIGAAILARTP